ncbi:MAG: NADH-quinone oxidoreductase subunit NuoH [Acidobacteria bacterium]|nr:NADH-quinone oxidoreductase subunit NuoH [Acidobacteriota bacterium]
MNAFLQENLWLVNLLVKIIALLFILLTAVAYLVWMERKVVAHIQSRWGPYRVGPHGLLQPLADGLKFLFKEDITPMNADPLLYRLAPFLSLTLALLAVVAIPFGPTFYIADLNIGLLFILAVTSLGVYGIALAGWASNSKYPLLGSLRSAAQMVSYELALGLGLVGVLMLSGTFNLREIVEQQAGFWSFQGIRFFPRWNILPQCVGFFVYFTAAMAETNRSPFDLPEAETELVAGFHTEYSSFKFAMFFIAEYTNMVIVSCLATLLFFGGWMGPVFGPPWLRIILPTFWFVLKVLAFMFFYIWTRGTLPRFRYDQLMAFGWKFLLPVGIFNILVTGFILAWQAS